MKVVLPAPTSPISSMTGVANLANCLPKSYISCSEDIFMIILYHENLYFWYIGDRYGAAGTDGG